LEAALDDAERHCRHTRTLDHERGLAGLAAAAAPERVLALTEQPVAARADVAEVQHPGRRRMQARPAPRLRLRETRQPGTEPTLPIEAMAHTVRLIASPKAVTRPGDQCHSSRIGSTAYPRPPPPSPRDASSPASSAAMRLSKLSAASWSRPNVL